MEDRRFGLDDEQRRLAAASMGGEDRLVDGLIRFLAEARVDAVVAERSRQRWLAQQAGEQTSLAGVFVDLAERREPMSVRTLAGRTHRGVVVGVGVDFAAVRTDTGQDVLVASSGVAAVRPQPGSADRHGDRPVTVDMRLADILPVIAADRPRVLVVTTDGDGWNGELRTAGIDVLAVRLDGDGTIAYLPLHAVTEIARTGLG